MKIIRKIGLVFLIFVLSVFVTNFWMNSDLPIIPDFVRDWLATNHITSAESYVDLLEFIVFTISVIVISIIVYLSSKIYRKVCR